MGTWTADIQAAFQEEDRAKLSTGGKKMTITDKLLHCLETTDRRGALYGLADRDASLAPKDDIVQEKMSRQVWDPHRVQGAGTSIESQIVDHIQRAIGSGERMDSGWCLNEVVELAKLVDEALDGTLEDIVNAPDIRDHPAIKGMLRKEWDRALAFCGYAPYEPPEDNDTYFLIRCAANGATHVTEHGEEGLLEVIRLLRPVKSTVGYSDTSVWGDGFLVIRGEIARLNPRYTTSPPRRVMGWEID